MKFFKSNKFRGTILKCRLAIFSFKNLRSFKANYFFECHKSCTNESRFHYINGVFGYNLTEDALMEMELDDAVESRIEIISKEIKEYWDENLISCLTDS